jgi:type IV pilus assembly protein PilB
MKELILHNASSKDIWTLARKEGAKTLFEDGLEKVKSGATSIEEVIRIAPPQD